jgi:multidrug efflux system outer membrane protein
LGSQSGLALAQAQSTVDSARADAAAFDSQVEQDRNALACWSAPRRRRAAAGADPHWPPHHRFIGTRTAWPAAAAGAVPAGLPSACCSSAPTCWPPSTRCARANADIGAARAAFFPRIALTASAGTASSTLSGLFKRQQGAWSFAPSVSVPIFDGGANRANLDAGRAQQKIQLATYEKTVQTAFREVADALAERAHAGRALAAQRSLLGATRSFDAVAVAVQQRR